MTLALRLLGTLVEETLTIFALHLSARLSGPSRQPTLPRTC